MWCKVPKAASTSLLHAYLELAHVPHHQIPEVTCQAHVKSDSLMVKRIVLLTNIFICLFSIDIRHSLDSRAYLNRASCENNDCMLYSKTS